ncbi:unnamed protein product [Phaedon cochleariae]|uniref:Uncharacterized protein n=1 Tax=Phaedon cochleariae TaxID=80249 RepID=A0A9N9SA42_PHACE|nr:unnamed protein product [Phaedon cochleariae]
MQGRGVNHWDSPVYILLAVRGSPVAVRGSPVTVRGSPVAVRGSPVAVRGSPVAVRGSPVAVRWQSGGSSLSLKGDRSTTPENRKKLKHRYKQNDNLPSPVDQLGTWTETIPLTQNTKESVMGPLESFLRSINCYPEQDNNRKKEAAKSRPRFPLLQPTSPPPLSESVDCLQPSSSSAFSWTPSLLAQRRNNKPARGNEGSLPEREENDCSGDQPHSA